MIESTVPTQTRTGGFGVARIELGKKDLGEVFGKLNKKKDWHRVAERLSQFKKIGKPYGVNIVLQSARGSASVFFDSAKSLESFVQELATKRGYMQKSFSAVLQRRAVQAVDRRSVPAQLLRAQVALLKGTLSKDLGVFEHADLDAVLVDVPGGPSASAPNLMERLVRSLPGAVLIRGDAGNGKTAALYSLMSRWHTLGPALAGYTPAYISTKHLHFDWNGPFAMPWSAFPGVEPHFIERLEAALAAGRLVLLLDAINDNPACTDFTNPNVREFWRQVSRCPVIITTTARFYETHLKNGPLATYFRTGLARADLLPWNRKLYQELFSNLTRASKRHHRLGAVAGYLEKLSVQKWQRESNILRFTPLTGLAAANFFADHHGERFPRNEFEVLDHMLSYHLRHEGLKGSSVLVQDSALGLLMKVAWEAYVEGAPGKFACISSQRAGEVVEAHYPMLAHRKVEILQFLDQLPYLDFSLENGVFYINQQFCDFLVARHIRDSFLCGDYQRLKQVLAVSWQYRYVVRYFFQGLAVLSAKEQETFLRVASNQYRIYWEEFQRTREFRIELSIAQIVQPIGFMPHPGVVDFLWQVFRESEGKGNFVHMSAAIGLAWHDDPGALEAYVKRMRKSAKARDWNLRWYLFYRRQEKQRADIDNFSPELAGSWDRVCDWLLSAMLEGRSERDFYPVRLLYAFTFCDFIKRMGLDPFLPNKDGNTFCETTVEARLGYLEEIIAMWRRDPQTTASPALKRQFEEMVSLVAKIRKRNAKKGVLLWPALFS